MAKNDVPVPTETKKRAASPARKTGPAAKTAPAKRARASGSSSTAAASSPAKTSKSVQPAPVPSKPAMPAPPALKSSLAASKAAAEAKNKKKAVKLVRDSFTMPENEYLVLGEIKRKCLKAGIEVKKSQLLRIGVALIRDLDVKQLQGVLDTLPALKAGRPRKEKGRPA